MKYTLENIYVKATDTYGSIEKEYLPVLILKYILILDYGQTNTITGPDTWTKTIPVILCSPSNSDGRSHGEILE